MRGEVNDVYKMRKLRQDEEAITRLGSYARHDFLTAELSWTTTRKELEVMIRMLKQDHEPSMNAARATVHSQYSLGRPRSVPINRTEG